MINNELFKRILTSFLLIVLIFFLVIINIYIFLLGLVTISSICFFEWNNLNAKHFSKKKKNLMPIVIFFGLFYLLIFIISSYILYDYFGPYYYVFILTICANSDIGGYIIGRTIGGIKLTKISPNKTASGSLGSFIFSLIPILLLSLQDYFFLDFHISLINILVCLFISLSCQLGDLIISFFKRLNKVKDTGKILPGHGGLLDRIDGIIFAVPAFLILQLTLTL